MPSLIYGRLRARGWRRNCAALGKREDPPRRPALLDRDQLDRDPPDLYGVAAAAAGMSASHPPAGVPPSRLPAFPPCGRAPVGRGSRWDRHVRQQRERHRAALAVARTTRATRVGAVPLRAARRPESTRGAVRGRRPYVPKVFRLHCDWAAARDTSSRERASPTPLSQPHAPEYQSGAFGGPTAPQVGAAGRSSSADAPAARPGTSRATPEQRAPRLAEIPDENDRERAGSRSVQLTLEKTVRILIEHDAAENRCAVESDS